MSETIYFYGQELTIHGNEGWYWNLERPINKNGKPSTKRWDYHSIKFTPLKACECCGKISTPHNIQYRYDVYNWTVPFEDKKNWFKYEHKTTLCMICWNKAAQIMYLEELMKEQLQLTKQLTTWIWHEKRSKHDNKND